MAATTTGVVRVPNVSGPVRTGCVRSTRSPIPTPRSRAATHDRTIPGRPAGNRPSLTRGCQTAPSGSTRSSWTSNRRPPWATDDASRSAGSALAMGDPAAGAARLSALTGTGACSTAVIRSGLPASASSRVWSSDTPNESNTPPSATTTEITAPMARTLMRVRRGVRTTLRTGIRPMLPPGRGSRRTRRARPLPAAARGPTRIASTGVTRTPRHTG